ncbi:MAG: fluoride efflux transporter CrcB [Thermoleophilia bacterium]
MMNYLVIGLGGFAGAVSRYVVAHWVGERWGRSFPFGTLVVNVSGCFLIGILMTIFLERSMVSPQWRSFLVVGFLGAYTTFSSFEYETGGLVKDGELLYAALNVILSVAAGFAALKLGEVLARGF